MKIPDRSVLVGFAVAFVVNLGVGLLQQWLGITIDPVTQGGIIATVTAVVIQLVPDSVQNIIDKLNNSIVIQAMRDPNSKVSATLPPQTTQPPQS